VQPELPASVAMIFEPQRDGLRAGPKPDSRERPAQRQPQNVPAAATPNVPGPPSVPVPPAAIPFEAPAPLPLPTTPGAVASRPHAAPDQSPPPSVNSAEPLPLPPPPGETLAARPSVAAARPRTPPPPARSEPKFPLPLAYSLGSAASKGAIAPPSLRPALGPVVPGDMSFGQFARITQGHVAPSWMNRLADWWEQHGYYPEQAAALRQDGQVQIEVVVDRYGKVRGVELVGRSGSPWLDLGAQAVFRGATVPPFPPDTADDQVTLLLTIRYILVRH
jgi:periplasmic protein TonB